MSDASRTGLIERFVGDDDYPLRLAIRELRILEESRNAGISLILHRLMSSTWMVDDVIEPIRLGLIGGGMDDAKAKTLVKNYVIEGRLLKYVVVALDVLRTALIGNEEDQPDVGEPEAVSMKTETSDS